MLVIFMMLRHVTRITVKIVIIKDYTKKVKNIEILKKFYLIVSTRHCGVMSK